MGIDRLDTFFHPASVAIVGASERNESVGRAVMQNLIAGGFDGPIHPINPRRSTIMNRRASSSLTQIDDPVDLVVITTPMETVPAIIDECVLVNASTAIIISAGGKETGSAGKLLENRILQAASETGLRILGPNCLGVMCQSSRLNATLATKMPMDGRLAFISQSAAICTAILDYSLKENIGFSYFIGLGSMLDVNFGDVINYLCAAPKVSSILMYVESLSHHRQFMSAARAASRVKPIIALKAGRSAAGAAAAALHTGATAGEDEVFDTAFERAGIVRVKTFEELFDAAEILSRRYRFRGPGLTIVTNGGGPGVMAADALADYGLAPSHLAPETRKTLDSILPGHWSRNNPIDILGDATPERYAAVANALAQDRAVQALLFMLAPQAITDAGAVAQTLADRFRESDLPVIASWMGGAAVENGRHTLNQAGIATFDTPERAVRAFMNLCRHNRNLEMLQQIPSRLSRRIQVDRDMASTIVQKALASKAGLLTNDQARQLIGAYGIVIHPMDGETDPAIMSDLECPFMAGAKHDPGFGPVIYFGMGGVLAELIGDRAMALPPLNRLLAARLMEATRIDRLTKGEAQLPPASREPLEGVLIRLSQLAIDFPEIQALDINPLILKKGQPVGLNARVVLQSVTTQTPFHLAISPYPAQLESHLYLDDVGELLIRPIRPEDAPLLLALFEVLSSKTVYYRFFSTMRQLSPAMVARFTQIDYDREIALVAILETPDGEKMIGAARVILQHNLTDGEFSVLIGDPWQGKGIGAHLLSRVLDIARQRGFRKIWGLVLAENKGMLSLGRKLQFTINHAPGQGEYELSLDSASSLSTGSVHTADRYPAIQ